MISELVRIGKIKEENCKENELWLEKSLIYVLLGPKFQNNIECF